MASITAPKPRLHRHPPRKVVEGEKGGGQQNIGIITGSSQLRLVEKEDVKLVQHAASDLQATLHPA